MTLADKIKATEKLTGYRYVKQENEIAYMFKGTKITNHFKYFEIFLPSQPKSPYVLTDDGRELPIEWLKPLSEIWGE